MKRPATERYMRLIEKLVAANYKLDSDDDPLKVVGVCVAAVVEFLHADPVVLDHGWSRPLIQLAKAIDDRVNGEPAPLLAARPRGTGLAFDMARGELAAVLDGLAECYQGSARTTGAAADWLAAELLAAGIVLPKNGKPFTADTLRRWREDAMQQVRGLPVQVEVRQRFARSRIAALSKIFTPLPRDGRPSR